MNIVRVQTGHWGRKTGATGAYNPRLKVAEADMNHRLSLAVQKVVANDKLIVWQFVGPDEKRGDPCNLFLALHMDGSGSATPAGPSIGYPPGSVESYRFGKLWKKARTAIPGALPFDRQDNYTAALRGYYGYRSAYSGSAAAKLVIENGFVTNDQECLWTQMHRQETAEALVDTVRAYLGVVGDGNELEGRVLKLERQVERLSIQNARQAKYIGGLQERVTVLEGNG